MFEFILGFGAGFVSLLVLIIIIHMLRPPSISDYEEGEGYDDEYDEEAAFNDKNSK